MCESGVGESDDDRGEGECAESRGARGGVSELRVGGDRRVEECVVLGRVGGADGGVCGVREGFQGGAAVETLTSLERLAACDMGEREGLWGR